MFMLLILQLRVLEVTDCVETNTNKMFINMNINIVVGKAEL
jgi:hypothetical protein